MRPHRPTRRLATAAAVLVLCLSAISTPAAAGPDDVRSAKAQLVALQARVAAVAANLEKGTREYDAGQRHLADVQRKQRDVERQAAGLRRAGADQQRRLDRMAAAAYRHPMPTMLSLAMTTDRTRFTAALSASADLEHVSGRQQDVLRDVVAARVQLQGLARSAQQLTDDARRTEHRLSAQLERLRSTAAQAQRELEAAAARLARAQAAERSRLDQLRAERARQAASRSRIVRSGGPSCTGESTDGYPNGFLPESALCPLWQASGERLQAAAAAAFNQMSQYHAAATGSPLCVRDSYRSYARQVAMYQSRPDLAATPGTSEHGWGRAVDLCGGVERYGSDAYQWMKANSGRFGFFHPDWAEPSGGRPEPWHWEYGG